MVADVKARLRPRGATSPSSASGEEGRRVGSTSGRRTTVAAAAPATSRTACPRAGRPSDQGKPRLWACTSCQYANPVSTTRCAGCLRQASTVGCIPEGTSKPLSDSGTLPDCPAAFLMEALTTRKGMPRGEVEALLQSAGLVLPPPIVAPRSEMQTLDELQQKVLALTRRREELSASQLELVSAQAQVDMHSQQVQLIEADIYELKQLLAVPDLPSPATRMPETDALLSAFEHMSNVLMSPDTMQANYHRYASATSAEGRQPLEQFPWMAQETSAASRSGIEALAMIKAAVAHHDAVDDRGRPRKAPRTSEGYPAAAPEGSSSPI